MHETFGGGAEQKRTQAGAPAGAEHGQVRAAFFQIPGDAVGHIGADLENRGCAGCAAGHEGIKTGACDRITALFKPQRVTRRKRIQGKVAK